MSSDDNLTRAVERYLERHHPAALGFWTDAHDIPETSIQSLCDVFYIFHMLDITGKINPGAANTFIRRIATVALSGGLTTAGEDAKHINVHGTAYVLGTLRLLQREGLLTGEIDLPGRRWNLSQLFDETWRPRWPAKYSHHNWRVSHWIGGSVSIVANLHRLCPTRAIRENVPALAKVLERANSLIDPRTGLLKCYRSDLLQIAFRNVYRLRHDPDAGDIGGVVHLQWVNYANGNMPYKAAGAMLETATRLLDHRPFQEGHPYCLDFDVLQIVRTGLTAAPDPALIERSKAYGNDIESYLMNSIGKSYSLHALPGALATMHEAALLQNLPFISGSGIRVVDIIKDSGWI